LYGFVVALACEAFVQMGIGVLFLLACYREAENIWWFGLNL